MKTVVKVPSCWLQFKRDLDLSKIPQIAFFGNAAMLIRNQPTKEVVLSVKVGSERHLYPGFILRREDGAWIVKRTNEKTNERV